jgi:hypothetical protein
MDNNFLPNNNSPRDQTLKETEILTNYNLVSHFDKPLEEPEISEWRFYIKEEHQPLKSYVQEINPNYKSKVLLRVDKDHVINCEHLIIWLNEIYNIQIVSSNPINVDNAPSTICNLIRKSGWRGMLFSPIAYLGTSYIRKRNLSQIGHVQYSGNLIMVQAAIKSPRALDVRVCRL